MMSIVDHQIDKKVLSVKFMNHKIAKTLHMYIFDSNEYSKILCKNLLEC